MVENLQVDDNATAAQVKMWLEKHGKFVLAAIGLAIAITLGYQFYQNHQYQTNVAASKLYDEYQQALLKGEEDALKASFNALRENYSETAYASAVTLLEASRAAFDEHYADAETLLEWLQSNGRDFVKPLAALRLAQLKFEQQDFEGALSILQKTRLNADNPKSPKAAYLAGFQELRGDIAIAQGEPHKAAEYYEKALAAYEAQDFNNILLQMKVETYR